MFWYETVTFCAFVALPISGNSLSIQPLNLVLTGCFVCVFWPFLIIRPLPLTLEAYVYINDEDYEDCRLNMFIAWVQRTCVPNLVRFGGNM